MTGSESVRRVVLYVRAIGSNTPRGWLNIAVFSKAGEQYYERNGWWPRPGSSAQT